MKQFVGGFIVPLIVGVVTIALCSAYPWMNNTTTKVLRGLLLAAGVVLIAAAVLGLYIIAPSMFTVR